MLLRRVRPWTALSKRLSYIIIRGANPPLSQYQCACALAPGGELEKCLTIMEDLFLVILVVPAPTIGLPKRKRAAQENEKGGFAQILHVVSAASRLRLVQVTNQTQDTYAKKAKGRIVKGKDTATILLILCSASTN